MATAVEQSILVRRSPDLVAKVATDPALALPVMAGLGRFAFIGGDDWDVFLDVGTIHVGGRVVVSRPDPTTLSWRAVRGTRHTFELRVTPEGEDSRITVEMTVTLAGGAAAYVAERLGRGIVARHLEAGLQQLRHFLEFGDVN